MSAHSQHAGRRSQAASPDTGRAGIGSTVLLENSLSEDERRKQLIREKNRRFRLRHPERVKADNARRAKARQEWADANRERVREQKRQSALRHPETAKRYQRSEKYRLYHKARYAANSESVKQRAKKWKDENKARHLETVRRWQASHPVRTKELKQKCKRKARTTLSDSYVKQELARKTTLRHSDIPQELVELKRAHLKIHRQLKAKK